MDRDQGSGIGGQGSGIGIVVVVACLGMASAPAGAQTPAATRPAEIGVGAGGVASWFGVAAGGGTVRLSAPVGRHYAVEPFVSLALSVNTWGDGHEGGAGLYGVQVKRRIERHSSDARELFLTLGAIGIVTRSASTEYPYTRHGMDTIRKSPMKTHASPPVLGLVGVGVQRALTRHLAVRADVQAITLFVVPLGIRASASVSVPFGAFAERQD